MSWLRRQIKRLWFWLWLTFKASLVTALVAGLLWGGLQLWHLWQNHQSGKLVTVELTSTTSHVSEDELRLLLRPQLGLGFWQLDLPMIRTIIESHPWVASAQVSRFWPNSLRIEVVEKIPVARWGVDSLLSQTGDIFHPNKAFNSNDLIALSAINPEPKEVLAMLRALLGLINPYGLHIRALHQQADDCWHLWLINGDEWMLPAQASLVSVKQLLLLYGSIPRRENANMRIDLRYRDGFAVKWFDIETMPTVTGG
jgi:cell division protein FtsQ